MGTREFRLGYRFRPHDSISPLCPPDRYLDHSDFTDGSKMELSRTPWPSSTRRAGFVRLRSGAPCQHWAYNWWMLVTAARKLVETFGR